jgi:hypothetical protein
MSVIFLTMTDFRVFPLDHRVCHLLEHDAYLFNMFTFCLSILGLSSHCPNPSLYVTPFHFQFLQNPLGIPMLFGLAVQ